MGGQDWNMAMVDIPLGKLLWEYSCVHAGVTGNDWADRLASKTTITRGLRRGKSEVSRSLRHYCGHHGKDVTPSIASRIVGRETLDNLPRNDERGPLSIRRTLELFQRQRRESFWETGGSHMGFSERIDTILNWTWMWWFYSKQHASSITIHPSLTLRFQSQVCRHIKYGSFAYWLLSYHENKTDSINS